jgi:tetratricopeptide (TPR) repeat protein
LSTHAFRRSSIIQRLVAATIAVSFAVLQSACSTTPSQQTQTRIDIEKDVGFTITEEARIGANVRADYDAAMTLLEQGHYSEGIKLLEAITEKAPTLTAPRIDLGIAQHRAGNLDAAEKNLRKALELAPNHPIVHNELGIIYRKSGRFDEARKSYEAALAVYPGYHFARRNLAILCDLYLADLECALENYQAYMATVSSDDEVAMWMTDIRRRLGQ